MDRQTASNEIAKYGNEKRHAATDRLLAYNSREAREDRIAAEVVYVPDAAEAAYGRTRVGGLFALANGRD